jgi:heme-degrading monooxygenase HmoA
VVVEYIRYAIAADQAAAFEDAYRRAGVILGADGHCLGHEIARGVEHPDRYVVRIEWDSVEGHEQGFRKSPAFSDFYALVKPFFDEIEEMTHYSPPEDA